MSTMRLTMAQALVRFLAAQRTVIEGAELPLFAGVFAIFGHGNVAGLGEALQQPGDALPTLRAHNEQAMAHAAIAFAKTLCRRRMMACTTSIGPGATSMVTAAAVAHLNRLPVLLLPGDVFASRRPCRQPRRARLEGQRDRRARGGTCRGQGGDTDHRHRHHHRSRRHDAQGRCLVGRRCPGGLGAPRGHRRARGL